mmetsp:Transcript_20652/g.42668  ORF Transcript_20652/g.42668 Transcript_20652/m.42668 type:complete len:94 (-) Transcript_20652:239-520(-)
MGSNSTKDVQTDDRGGKDMYDSGTNAQVKLHWICLGGTMKTALYNMNYVNFPHTPFLVKNGPPIQTSDGQFREIRGLALRNQKINRLDFTFNT